MIKVTLLAILITSPALAVTDYQLDGVTTPVKQSTSTPANSKPLPTANFNTSGVPVNLATEATATSSLTELQGVNTKLTTANGHLDTLDNTVGSAGSAITLPGFNVLGSDGTNFRSLKTNTSGQIETSPAPNVTGTYAEITNLTTVAQTFTAPANAVGFSIQALSSNTVNLRFKVGAAATISSGVRLEPGRSEYFPLGANISVIAESGTNQAVNVQWVSK